MPKCDKCGASNSDRVRYCASCGYELPRYVEKVQPQKAEPLEVRPNNHKLAIAIAIGVGIVLVALANYGTYHLIEEKKTEFRRMTLVESVSYVNRKCPVMIDYATRLDNVVAVEDKEVQYNYTLVSLEKETMDAEALKNEMEPNMLRLVKTNHTLKPFRDMGVILSYHYKDRNGEELFKIVFTPEQYNTD